MKYSLNITRYNYVEFSPEFNIITNKNNFFRETWLRNFKGHPSRHKTLEQRWFKVGPPSTTLAQGWTNAKTTLIQRLVSAGT